MQVLNYAFTVVAIQCGPLKNTHSLFYTITNETL